MTKNHITATLIIVVLFMLKTYTAQIVCQCHTTVFCLNVGWGILYRTRANGMLLLLCCVLLYALAIDSTGSSICLWEETMKVSAISY